jgi:hypothetical protein
MALSKLIFKPGINRDQTNYASEGGWYSMDKVRFRSGFPEKFGGWRVETQQAYEGVNRSILSWTTTDGNRLVGLGTNEKIYVSSGTQIYDITPTRATYTSTTTPSSDDCFETTNGSNLVEIINITAGAENGDWVTFSGVTNAVGGVPAAELNGEHQLIFDDLSNKYYITVTTAATSSVVSTGNITTIAVFQINVGFPYTVAGFGWGAGVWGAGAWGASSLTPIYEPVRLIFQDTFVDDLVFNTRYTGAIETPSNAVTDGFIYYWVYDNTFANKAVLMSSLVNSIAVPQRVIKSMFNPNGFLLALGCTNFLETTTPGAVINTITRGGTGNLTATVTTSTAHGLTTRDWITMSNQEPAPYQGFYQVTVTSPTTFTYIMEEAPSGSASVEGTYVVHDYTGGFDPLLVRWSNVDPDTGPIPWNWDPTPDRSTAGFLRLQIGSTLVTGIVSKQETLLWTDTALYSLQFISGSEEVFTANLLSAGISIAGPNAVAQANNLIYWMGRDKFYVSSGRVETIPCTLRQYVFTDINFAQSALFFAGTNNQFSEVIFFYASKNSNEIDRYVVYNYSDSIWYYGTLVRTSWIDAGAIPYPQATNDGYLYYHEFGTDDGQPLAAPPLPIEAYIQSADVDIEDGDKFMLVRRVIPDVNFRGSETTNPVTGAPLIPEADITVGVRQFPGANQHIATINPEEFLNTEGQSLTNSVITEATINTYTNQIFVRARGRQMNFKISSNTLGTQWQLGMPRVDARPDGTRG